MTEHHRLPHLTPFADEPIVFVTVVTHDRLPLLACNSAHDGLRTVWAASHNQYGWAVGRYVVMPDHVHFFARGARGAKQLSQWMQAWKSLSSRALATNLHVPPPIWQRDYFDRFLRSSDNYSEKWNYVRENPVRKGLIASADAWPWQGVIHDLQY
jgi:putative transposase